MERVVVVGAGQGGLQLAASLREGGFSGSITLLGEEPHPPYQRPPLSKAYLTGKMTEANLWLRSAAFYAGNGIELLTGERAIGIDRAARRVALASGASLPYDHLVLATGTRNRLLPVPGADLDGVVYLRTLADAQALKPRLEAVRRAVVVGAGFIGLEFAAVARAQGLEVDVFEAAERPLGRAVSAPVSAFFADWHRAQGTRLHLGAGVARILGRERVEGVETRDGERIPADLVLVGIGVLPNAELAEAAGLACANGIVVDEHLHTEDAAISAIGDCAVYPSRFTPALVRLESVQNAADQARCVAARILGEAKAYAAVPWFWSDQGELKLQIAGLTWGFDEAVTRGDPAGSRFSVFCFKEGRLLGVESVNRPGDHMAARRLLGGSPELTPAQAGDEGFDLKAHVARRG